MAAHHLDQPDATADAAGLHLHATYRHPVDKCKLFQFRIIVEYHFLFAHVRKLCAAGLNLHGVRTCPDVAGEVARSPFHLVAH